MKRLVLILMSCMLLLQSFVLYAAPVDAAVVSKVASAAAKKVAKENIKDRAVELVKEISTNAITDAALQSMYKTDAGYTLACLDGKSTCDKPVQIKSNLTDVDKTNIAAKAEQLLETKTGTGGWGKYLDWFVPIFILGTAFTWITSKLDDESVGLFNDIAKETVTDLGLVKPVPAMPTIVPDIPNPTNEDLVPTSSGVSFPVVDTRYTTDNMVFGLDGSTYNEMALTGQFYSSTGGWLVDIVQQNNDNTLNVQNIRFMNSENTFGFYTSSNTIFHKNFFNGSTSYGVLQRTAVAFMDGVLIRTGSAYDPNDGTYITTDIKPSDVKTVYIAPIQFIEGRSLPSDWRRVDIVDSNAIYSVSYLRLELKNGSVAESVMTAGYTSVPSSIGYTRMDFSIRTTDLNLNQVGIRLGYSGTGQFETIETYVPQFDELPAPSPILPIIPPNSVPIQTPEGVPVQPSPNVPGEWVNPNTGETVPNVNEDTLIVGDPLVTPDGVQIPGGEIVPKPEPKPEPKPDENAGGGEDMVNNFTCSRDLLDIDFKPVSSAFTTSFPFSIPWDIKRFVDNALGTLGEGQKPQVALTFLGDGVVLKMPDMIDNWMPFLRNLVIIMFDISLVYLFFRWTKGGGN